jgi:hypothetical protein
MVGLIQLISVMSYQPPVDQRIVDEYFTLISKSKTKDVGWLYAMVATYGVKPEDLIDFEWGSGVEIFLKTKKRSLSPLHPQWVLLFELKEKQPRNLRSCWSSLHSSLCQAIAYQKVSLNITDLLLAYRLRKNHYQGFKRKQASIPVFAGVS